MPVFNNQLAGAAGSAGGGYTIERSLRFNPDDASHLSRTPSTAGNTKKFTVSVWAKRSSFDTHDHLFQSGNSYFRFQSDGSLIYYWNGSDAVYTTAKFRDVSAWYHLVLVVDTTQASTTHRVKMWVNGVQAATTGTWMGKDSDVSINGTAVHYIGAETASTSVSTLDGYMADFHLLDGIAISDPDGVFGEFDGTSGIWNPIEYDGDYNGAAVAGTSYSSATGAKSLYSTTNDGQTTGTGYSSGATSSAVLLVPGINLTEEGASNQSISNNGATSVTSGTKYYGAAIQFATAANQGSNASNSLSFSNNLGLSGADFFTFEAWVYPRSGHTQDFVIVFEGDWNNNNGLMFYLNSSRYPSLTLGDGSFQSFYSSQQVPYDKWTHVACVNLNNTISFFVNGNKDTASGTRSKNYTLGGNHRIIGAYRDSNHVGAPRNPFYGYMCDIRVTADSKYTSSFTVPGSGAIPAGVNGAHLDFSDTSNVGADSSGGSNDYAANNFSTVLGSGNYISELSNTANGGDYTGRYSDAFDGNLATESYGFNNDTITWTPAGGKAYTSARVYGRGESGNNNGLKYKLVGGSETTITVTTSGAWYTLPANGTIEYISWNRPGSTNVTTFVSAIEINGTILVDNSRNAHYDSLLDSPTDYIDAGGVGGNYATLNLLAGAPNQVLSNGNLTLSRPGTQWGGVPATIGMTSGKYQFEVVPNGHQYTYVGIINADSQDIGYDNSYIGGSANSWGVLTSSGDLVNATNSIQTSGGQINGGQVVTVTFDADIKQVKWYVDGTLLYTQTVTGPYPFFFATGSYNSGHTVNFGQRPFMHGVTGFKSLCTQNLPTPPIAKGKKHFDTKTYTGNGGTQTISGLEFSPDVTLIKARTGNAYPTYFDTVRGTAKRLSISPSGGGEADYGDKGVTAFGTNSFTVTDNSNGDYNVNGVNGGTYSGSGGYVGWAWDIGSSNTAETVGSLNNVLFNMSEVWSNGVSGNIQFGQATDLFDGTTNNNVIPQDNGTLTWSPSSTITASSSIRIWMEKSGNNLLINGVNVQAPNNPSGHWYTYSGSTLSSIQWGRTDSGNQIQLAAIEIDGKILKDSNMASTPSLGSTNRTNATAGMTVIKYTASGTAGATIKHNLGKEPKFIIAKNLDATQNWFAYHASQGQYKGFNFNQTQGVYTDSGYWADTRPTDQVITLGNYHGAFGTHDYIMYAFAEIEGFSKFGQFTSNNSTDNAFVYTGFTPQWVIWKNITLGGWFIYDAVRNTSNPVNAYIEANSNASEATATGVVDFCSNGFKTRNSFGGTDKFVYACFAANPFKIARAQ
jgi:hypothetical protein